MTLGSKLLSSERVIRHIQKEKSSGDQALWRAFLPTSDSLLSGDQGSKITIQESIRRFRSVQAQRDQPQEIAGACSLLVADIEKTGLLAYEDPVPDGEYKNLEHVSVDFTPIPEKERQKDKARQLAAIAGKILDP